MSSNHQTRTCLEAALQYLSEGKSVIPVRTWELGKDGKANKKPCVPWREYAKRLPTEAEVRNWWDQFPEAGVAIVCGAVSNMVVVDLDARGGADMDVSKWEDTFTVESPGGMHLIYSHPGETVRPSAGKLGQGVDVRGDDSYIITAPTVRADGGEYRVADPLPVAKYPYLKVAAEVPDLSFSTQESWAEKVLKEGVQEGGRNDTLARLAGLFASRNFPEPAALAQLSLWNENRCKPPIDHAELVTTVRSIYHKELQKRAGSQKKPEEMPIQLLRFTDFLEKYGGVEIEWLIKDWVPKASIGFVVSPPECYKSWLTGDIAASIVTGEPLLGQFPIEETGPVVVMQQEDHHGQTAERYRIQLLAKGNGSIPEQAQDLWIQQDRDFHFDNADSMKRLEEMIAEIKPALVIIDPLYACVDTKDSMVAAARSMKPLKELRDRYGTCFLLVHHAGKSKTMDFDRERAWGSQFLNAFVEFGMQIAKPDDAQTLTKRHFKMCGTPGYVSVDWHINTRDGASEYRPNCRELRSDEVEEIVSKYNSRRSGEAKAEREGGYEVVQDPTVVVRDLLQKNGPMERAALLQESGLSRKDLKTALDELMHLGSVGKSGKLLAWL